MLPLVVSEWISICCLIVDSEILTLNSTTLLLFFKVFYAAIFTALTQVRSIGNRCPKVRSERSLPIEKSEEAISGRQT